MCPAEAQFIELVAPNAEPDLDDSNCLWSYEFSIPAGVIVTPQLVFGGLGEAVGGRTSHWIATTGDTAGLSHRGPVPLFWYRDSSGQSGTTGVVVGLNLDRVQELDLLALNSESTPLQITAATENAISFQTNTLLSPDFCCLVLRADNGMLSTMAIADSATHEASGNASAALTPAVVFRLRDSSDYANLENAPTGADVIELLPTSLRGALEEAGVHAVYRVFEPTTDAVFNGRIGFNHIGEPTWRAPLGEFLFGPVQSYPSSPQLNTVPEALWESGELAAVEVESPEMAATYVPNDPLFADQWYLQMQSPTECGKPITFDIGADQAWNITRGSILDTVAILDTGLDIRHQEFASHYGAGRGFVPPFYAWVDTMSGGNKHGTATAGIVAALADNSLGLSGVAPLSIPLPVGALNTAGGGLPLYVAQSIAWTTSRKIPVVNMSLAFVNFPFPAYPPPPNPEDYIRSPYMNAACRNALYSGQLLVAAMGNDGDAGRMWPAGYDKSVLAVGAVTSDGNRWSDQDYWGIAGSGSNYGSWIDIAAPGGALMLAPRTGPSGYYDLSDCDLYTGTFFTGTSSAAPVVSGVASLLHSLDPDLLGEDIAQIMFRTAYDVEGAGFDTLTGYGVVNAADAVEFLGHGTKIVRHAAAGLEPSAASLAVQDTLKLVQRRFIGVPGLPADTTLNVNVVRLKGWVPFAAGFSSIPAVWTRASGTLGVKDTTTFNYEYEVMEGQLLGASVSASGCSVRTSVFELPGWGWFPLPPESARVAVTALGPSPLVDAQPLVGLAGHLSVYPNPSSGGSVRIAFSIPATDWSLQLVDVTGRVVRRLAAGRGPQIDQRVAWDGRNEEGVEVPAGVYFVSLRSAAATHQAKRVIVLR